MLGGLGLKIRHVPAMEDTETILASVSNPSSRGGNRFLGTLTLIGVKHLKEANLSQKWSMEVRCSALRRTVLSVDEITVESADMVQMPASVVVRVDTWSDTVQKTEVRLELILNLGLTNRVHQQPSLPRGTNFMP